jgi:hypothetical protein
MKADVGGEKNVQRAVERECRGGRRTEFYAVVVAKFSSEQIVLA